MNFKLGIDNILNNIDLFKNKRVGLITNPTGVDSNLKSSIDILKELTDLRALYSPEHGVRGNIQAGEKLETYIDNKTNCPVYSLYGKTKKPTKEMLEDIDILCIDIQSVGSRFYTYIYTMAYAMEACKEFGKQFVVFDRPNPIGGEKVEGNILDINYRSFIGYYPIVQRHSLTIGELAHLYNEEFGIGCNLVVVKMDNWERWMDFEDTNLNWVMPSPNLPTVDSTYVYNASCVFEGTNISEGRGTTRPFEIVGAPWLDADLLANKLNNHNLPGVIFRATYFTPVFSKHANNMCGGVQIHISNRKTFEAVKTGWTMLYVIKEMNELLFEFRKPYKEGLNPMIDLNNGNSFLRENKYNLNELYEIIEKDSAIFKNIVNKYYLY